MNEMFYYCKKCNKKIESRRNYCECGRPLLRSTLYTSAEIEQLVQKNENAENKDVEAGNVTAEDGEMICPICGKRYGVECSICDDCGMALQPYVQCTETQHIAGIVLGLDKYGTEIDAPTWKLKSKRYSQRTSYEGRDVIVNRSIMSLGRMFLDCNHIFSDVIDFQSSLIGRVSRYNAFLLVRDGNLYIQYDNTLHSDEKPPLKRRTPIYINGFLMGESECRRLMEGDAIVMGNGAATNMDLCAEFTVSSIRPEAAEMTANVEIGTILNTILKNTEQVIEGQGAMKESLDYAESIQRQTLSNTTEIKEGICNLENLQIEKYSNIAEYLKEIQEFEREYRKSEKTKAAEEYIDEHLRDYADKKEILNALNEAQRDCLYYAAFYESVIKKEGRNDADYSAPTIYIGKLLESYLYQTVRPMLERYFREQWNEVLQENKRFKNPALGDYTTAIDRAEEQNDALFCQIAEEVKKCCPEGALSESEVKEAFMSIDPVRSIRNTSAHSNVRAVWANQRKRVKYDEYIQAKNTLFRNKVFVRLSHCYRVLIKGK